MECGGVWHINVEEWTLMHDCSYTFLANDPFIYSHVKLLDGELYYIIGVNVQVTAGVGSYG